MDYKKLKILDKLSIIDNRDKLINVDVFDSYPPNIGEIIIGKVESDDDGNYSFVCNKEELSGVIEDCDLEDYNKVYLKVNGYDLDLYLINIGYIDID